MPLSSTFIPRTSIPRPTRARAWPVVVVVGPTASGKTTLAVRLAARFDGEIISADSRQVYRGMDIGTGKDIARYRYKIQKTKFNPSTSSGLRVVSASVERLTLSEVEGVKKQNDKAKFKIARVPYHLIDIVSPKSQFTVAYYQHRAYRAIEDILRRGKLPIICGGTGLYVDAVVQGYQLPQFRISNFEFRMLRQRLNRLSVPQLLARLRRVDPVTYGVIDRQNRRRVQRALEIFYATGKPKSAQFMKSAPPYRFLIIGLRLPHATHYRRIAMRLRHEFRQGLVAEVRRLHQRGLAWQRLDAFGLEYRWISRYLRGQVDRSTMERCLLSDIQKFSRRQMTWFRQNPQIVWVSGVLQARLTVRGFLRPG